MRTILPTKLGDVPLTKSLAEDLPQDTRSDIDMIGNDRDGNDITTISCFQAVRLGVELRIIASNTLWQEQGQICKRLLREKRNEWLRGLDSVTIYPLSNHCVDGVKSLASTCRVLGPSPKTLLSKRSSIFQNYSSKLHGGCVRYLSLANNLQCTSD